MTYYRHVRLLSRVRSADGCFAIDESKDPIRGDPVVQLTLTITLPEGDAHYSAVCPTAFGAFQRIRRQIEPLGWRLHCYGASLNVFPSRLYIDLSSGIRAYRMKMGIPAQLHDLVNIFDTGDDVILSTVAEQSAFYQSWLHSLHAAV